MKKKIKGLSLLMAGILATAPVVSTGNVVLANTVKNQAAGLSVQGQKVTKRLEKGDTFTIQLTCTTGSGSIANLINYIDLSGATNGNFAVNEVQINGDNTIIITDLVYNGEGNAVQVEIGYKGMQSDAPAMTSVLLENAIPKESAPSGLAVTNSVINVVTGERQQIAFSLVNKGNTISASGKMSFELEDKKASEGIVIKTKEVSIPEMRKGEQKDFNFIADIDEKVTRGIHKIKVKISDKDGKNTVEKTLQLKVESDFMPPSLQVAASNTAGFQLNQPQAIEIDVKNVGHVAAKNVKVEVVPNEKVVVADGSNVRYINAIESGKTEKVNMMLQVIDNKSVTIPLQMKLTYIDDLGKTQEDTQTLYINTQTTAFAKELTIKDIKEPSGIHKVGDTFGVGFTIAAVDGAKNVTVSVKGAEGIVPKSKNMFVINEISKGGAQNFHVNFTAGNTVVTGTHLIEIQAKYKLNNEDITISQYATVSIDNPKKEDDDNEEDTKKGQPKVIIGNYQSAPVVVKAGEQFELQLGFLNTHNQKSVHNLKANLTVREEGEKNTGSVFTPVNASNTFFIQDMAPGEMVTETITLYTIPSAVPKTYEISLEMEYEDAEGNPIKATENIGIPVEQVTKLEIADVQVDTVEVGMEAYLTARVYNTGKTSISNVKIKTVGEGFDVKENTMFIGVMEKGANESYEPIIIPNQGGTLQGQILIEYEDVSGAVQSMVHDFEMEVMESMVFPEGDGMLPPTEEVIPESEKAGIPWPVMLGLALGALIAAGITALVLKKRRKKQEELEIDED